jgi:hypothetical protein
VTPGWIWKYDGMKEGSISAVLSIQFLLLHLQLASLSHFLPQQNNKKSTHKKLRKS